MASAIGAIAIGWLRTAQQKKDSRERDLGRRQHPRWNWSATIEIRRLGQDHTWFVRAVNVSLGGMGVVSPEPLTADELVELKTDEHAETWVPARIANTTDPKTDGDKFRVGVEFLNEDLHPPGASRR